jgi:hypothetical protein
VGVREEYSEICIEDEEHLGSIPVAEVGVASGITGDFVDSDLVGRSLGLTPYCHELEKGCGSLIDLVRERNVWNAALCCDFERTWRSAGVWLMSRGQRFAQHKSSTD